MLALVILTANIWRLLHMHPLGYTCWSPKACHVCEKSARGFPQGTVKDMQCTPWHGLAASTWCREGGLRGQVLKSQVPGTGCLHWGLLGRRYSLAIPGEWHPEAVGPQFMSLLHGSNTIFCLVLLFFRYHHNAILHIRKRRHKEVMSHRTW